MGFKRQNDSFSIMWVRSRNIFKQGEDVFNEIQKENEIEKYLFSNQRTGILHNISQQELNRLQGLYIQWINYFEDIRNKKHEVSENLSHSTILSDWLRWRVVKDATREELLKKNIIKAKVLIRGCFQFLKTFIICESIAKKLLIRM